MALSENPNLALIPSGYKSGKIYSVLPTSGVGDFDFSRSGEATRINSQGLIETVADGVPRLNYPLIDGVVNGCPSHLLEPQRTQLIQYSEDFSNQSIWRRVTVNSNLSISPDGTLNADKLNDSTDNNSHYIALDSSFSLGSYSASIFAKKGTLNYLYIWFTGFNGVFDEEKVWFDLDNGTVGNTQSPIEASIEDYGNGWFRCSAKSTADIATSGRIAFGLSNADNVTSFIGSGTDNIYIWGAQVEAGSYPTSYIPNYGTAAGVTRSAETANGSGSASTFNSTEGVLMAEISALADDGTYNLISLSDGSSNNFIVIGYKDTSNNIFCDGVIGGTRFATSSATVNQEEFNKICLKYKSGDASIYLNGFEIVSSTTTFTHSGNPISELEFQYYNNTLPFYGNTKQIQYFDTALTDSELEKLTSWVSFQDMAEGQLYTIE